MAVSYYAAAEVSIGRTVFWLYFACAPGALPDPLAFFLPVRRRGAKKKRVLREYRLINAV